MVELRFGRLWLCDSPSPRWLQQSLCSGIPASSTLNRADHLTSRLSKKWQSLTSKAQLEKTLWLLPFTLSDLPSGGSQAVRSPESSSSLLKSTPCCTEASCQQPEPTCQATSESLWKWVLQPGWSSDDYRPGQCLDYNLRWHPRKNHPAELLPNS